MKRAEGGGGGGGGEQNLKLCHLCRAPVVPKQEDFKLAVLCCGSSQEIT